MSKIEFCESSHSPKKHPTDKIMPNLSADKPYSHRNALEILSSKDYIDLYKNLIEAIESVTEEAMMAEYQGRAKTPKSISKTINNLLKKAFEERQWKSEVQIFQGDEYKDNSWRLDFAKGTISVEVGFNHIGTVAWNLFKPTLARELNKIKKSWDLAEDDSDRDDFVASILNLESIIAPGDRPEEATSSIQAINDKLAELNTKIKEKCLPEVIKSAGELKSKIDSKSRLNASDVQYIKTRIDKIKKLTNKVSPPDIGVIICASEELYTVGGFDAAIGRFKHYETYLKSLNNVITRPLLIIPLSQPELFRIEHEKNGSNKVKGVLKLNEDITLPSIKEKKAKALELCDIKRKAISPEEEDEE